MTEDVDVGLFLDAFTSSPSWRSATRRALTSIWALSDFVNPFVREKWRSDLMA